LHEVSKSGWGAVPVCNTGNPATTGRVARINAPSLSLRVMGQRGFLDIALKKTSDEDLIVDPWLIVAGQNLIVTGGHADIWVAPGSSR